MNQLKGKTARESEVLMTEMVLPQHTNAIGTLFGGVVMSWIDIAAATCGLRHAGKQVVTASVDALEFLAPIRLGWIVTLEARTNYAHKTSCEVGVKVTAENPITGEQFHTASAYLTLVALDGNSRPTLMPPVLPETPEDQRRSQQAQERRKVRLQAKAQKQATKES